VLLAISLSEKTREFAKYLYGCLAIEKEVNLLYASSTKKLHSQQLQIIITALAYDNQKHAAVLQKLREPLFYIHLSSDELSKEFKKIICELSQLRYTIDMKGNLDKEDTITLLKSLAEVEDCLGNLYGNLIESKLADDYSNTVLNDSGLTSENLKYILQTLNQDNLKHRDMLIESLYFFNRNLQKTKDTTPIVRYQNPNAWVQL
jgi:hypothetical protein